MGEDLVDAFVERRFACVYLQLWGLWGLIRVTNTSEVFDNAGSCLGV